jgi:hypothetical protein
MKYPRNAVRMNTKILSVLSQRLILFIYGAELTIFLAQWSEFLALQTTGFQVLFPVHPDFLGSCGSATGSNHLREDN